MRSKEGVVLAFWALLRRMRDSEGALPLLYQHQELQGMYQSCVYGRYYGLVPAAIMCYLLRCGAALGQACPTDALLEVVDVFEALYGDRVPYGLDQVVREELMLHRVMARVVSGRLGEAAAIDMKEVSYGGGLTVEGGVQNWEQRGSCRLDADTSTVFRAEGSRVSE